MKISHPRFHKTLGIRNIWKQSIILLRKKENSEKSLVHASSKNRLKMTNFSIQIVFCSLWWISSRLLLSYRTHFSPFWHTKSLFETTMANRHIYCWPLRLGASVPGYISLYITVYYEVEDISSIIKYRTLRMHYDMQVCALWKMECIDLIYFLVF